VLYTHSRPDDAFHSLFYAYAVFLIMSSNQKVTTRYNPATDGAGAVV